MFHSLYFKRVIILAMTLLMVMAPLIASAGIVPCGRSQNDPATANNDMEECTFEHVILIIQNIINYIILIAAPIATIMFTYAGVEYVTAAGNTGKISQAHKIFWTVFVGFCIMLAAWLIVKSVSVLVDPSYSSLL